LSADRILIPNLHKALLVSGYILKTIYMARTGQTIQNNIAGFTLQWLQTAKESNGEFVKCKMRLAPKSYMPVRHIHPGQTETFEIMTGKLRIECGGITKIIARQESFTVPKGKPHQWWNESESDELEMIVTMAPAANWETQMEQVFGIMNAKGKLSFLQIMAMMKEYDMYIAGPPLVFQKILSSVLYPFAKIRGIKKFYPEYSR
jgi:mannose-6-phosphate isomerase-like protein (cupin superfamily)